MNEALRKSFKGSDKEVEEQLLMLQRKMLQYHQKFIDLMVGGGDFTLRLEVHGNCSELLHVRLYTDDIERPVKIKKK